MDPRVRSLRQRILLSALLGAVLTGLLGQLGLLLGTRGVVEYRLADLTAVVSAESLDRCAADPVHWDVHSGLVRVTAHAPDGGSRNPTAPVLAPALVPSLGDAARQLPDGPSRFWTRSAVHRVSESGPCAVLHATLPDAEAALPMLRFTGVAGVFLGVSLVALSTVLFALRPMLMRLRSLDQSAAKLGSDEFLPTQDHTDDELGRVARTVDASHARIIADQVALTERGEVLERHLAAVAHDLRTPIASLQLTLEGLENRAPADLASDLGATRLELSALEALADNLLQASRLQAGLDLQDSEQVVDLREVCSRVGTRFGILGRGRGVRVHVAVPDGPIRARCDPSLAERALANVVHNALVHGPRGASVGVSLDAGDGRFTVAVQSAGDALAPERLAAFSAMRLSQPDASRSRAHSGLGLGITNEVAERAGWSIHYSSGSEGGLRVEITGPTTG